MRNADANATRTGTAKWKRLRKQAIRRAIAQGQETCPAPGCGAYLDLAGTGEGAPIEVDHIIPFIHGGADHLDNLQVLCKTCNRRKGSGELKRARPIINTRPTTTVAW